MAGLLVIDYMPGHVLCSAVYYMAVSLLTITEELSLQIGTKLCQSRKVLSQKGAQNKQVGDVATLAYGH